MCEAHKWQEIPQISKMCISIHIFEEILEITCEIQKWLAHPYV